ncbi:hypothetical protein [Mycoplasma sp. 'Moose RK']|uniref:hypothetical protein n=1 Tax=Mycoplasma sp. 'Moose RK' TaxID=2780095 RepID=UPI0018C24801|nr:hypothetical protein [Mycoplasma sp. 'Moose RK']MBG0730615.1 hypothetical protein [Mycoplasma sp. 'Moose RK']
MKKIKEKKFTSLLIVLKYLKTNFQKNWFLSFFFIVFSIPSVLLFLFLWELDKKFDLPIYNSQNQQITIVKKNGEEFKNNEISEIKNLNSVKYVSNGESTLDFGEFTNKNSVSFNHIPTKILPVEINHFFKNDMKNYTNFQGKFLENDDQIIVSRDFANLNKVKIGDYIDYKYWISNFSTNKRELIYTKKFQIVATVGFANDHPDFLVLISNSSYKNLVKNIFDKSKTFFNQNQVEVQGQTRFFEFLIKNLVYYNAKTTNTKNTVDFKIFGLYALNSNKNFSLDEKDKVLKIGHFSKNKNEILVSQNLIKYFSKNFNLNLNLGDEITFKIENINFLFFKNHLFTFKISGILESDEINKIEFNKNIVQFFADSINENQPLKLNVFYDPSEQNGKNLLSNLEKKGFKLATKIEYGIHSGVASGILPMILAVTAIIILLLTVVIVFVFTLRNFKINNETNQCFSVNISKKILFKKENLYWIFIQSLIFIITFLVFLISIKLPFFSNFFMYKPINYIIGRISLDLLWILSFYIAFSTIIFKIITYFKNKKKSINKIKKLASK